MRCARVHLLAVDHVVVAVANRAAAQVGKIGTRMRLGKSETERDFPFDQTRNVMLLLLLRAGCHDRRCAAAAQRDIDANPSELLLDDVLR